MAHIDNVRLIAAGRLLTGPADAAGGFPSLFTLEGLGKGLGQEVFPGSLFSVKNISMGDLLDRKSVV